MLHLEAYRLMHVVMFCVTYLFSEISEGLTTAISCFAMPTRYGQINRHDKING